MEIPRSPAGKQGAVIASVAVDVIDGLMFGIPSSILLPKLNEKYDVPIAKLRKLYNALKAEYNQLAMEVNDEAKIRSSLAEALYDLPRLTDAYEAILSELAHDEGYFQKQKKLEETEKELNRIEGELSQAEERDKSSSSIGEWIRKELPLP